MQEDSQEPFTHELNTIALVGCYVPRQCGIATFTKDLRDGLSSELSDGAVRVLAMDDIPDVHAYSPEVNFRIRASQQKDYAIAADLLNINQIDMVVIQHEYGIYGGQDGAYVLDLVRRLRMPVMCTLHTVLEKPNENQARILRELGERCDRLIVMCHIAERILHEVYDIPEHKIAFIPHGIHETAFIDSSFYKDQYGVEGRTVLLTSGLLSAGKGIEVTLKALPAIVREHPEVVYLILGATHPHVLAREGDVYRHSLEALVTKSRLWDNVMFHNRFTSLEDFCGYIGASDIYLTPYSNPAQITSGTLAYAMGAGKAAVSTGYLYAQEMLADERGVIIPFGDSEALADRAIALLDNAVDRNAMRKRAYLYCRPMVWREVARSYIQLTRAILDERLLRPRTQFAPQPERSRTDSIPAIDLRHLRSLTDDTGMLQHAIYTVADRQHGYTTDDNTRALAVVLQYYDLRRDASVLPLAMTYFSFLHNAFNEETSRFRNFMSYDRQWLEDVGSEDVHGRAIWVLGLAAALAPNDGLLAFATRLFNRALPTVLEFGSPRAWSFALIGIHYYLRRFSGDVQARHVRKVLAERLFQLFTDNADADWPWPEETVTYANGSLPHALLLSGQWIPCNEMIDQALRSLQWLLDVQTTESGGISLIGNHGWFSRTGFQARFDQQPLEIVALIDACAEAYGCTKDLRWIEHARRCLDWFLGNNDVRAALFDSKTGGCRDGLQSDGPNQNEGAESTVAWLLSLIRMHQIAKDEKRMAAILSQVRIEQNAEELLCPSQL